jgi:DNA-binding MarR family transcriptional regulator
VARERRSTGHSGVCHRARRSLPPVLAGEAAHERAEGRPEASGKPGERGCRYVVPVHKPLDLPFDPIARAAEIWERRFGDSRAMAAVTSIMRAQQILIAGLDGLLRPHGLTFARYEALVLLRFSREGALPLRLIGQRLMVHPTSVTNTINRLEAQGLVVRRPNPADGRGTLAEITMAGREVVERATKDLMAADFGLGGYDRRDLEEMFGMLRGLRVTAGDFREH